MRRDMFVDALKLRNSYGFWQKTCTPRRVSSGAIFRRPTRWPDDLERDSAVAKLGGQILARLVVVSNRVAVPDGKNGGRAGGLEVAVNAALRHREGVWLAGAETSPKNGDRSRPRRSSTTTSLTW